MKLTLVDVIIAVRNSKGMGLKEAKEAVEELVANAPIGRLMDATHLALGVIIAKEGADSAAGYFLASALKECGSDSSYVRELCARREALSQKDKAE